jgi:hypothetical protein
LLPSITLFEECENKDIVVELRPVDIGLALTPAHSVAEKTLQLPIKATSLTFTFNETEDRLVVLASNSAGAKIGLLLTRRMTGRLINGLAGILEKSSLTASHAPAEMRGDVVLLEHQGAISDTGAHERIKSAPDIDALQVAQQTVHIESIDVSVKLTHFEIVLQDGRLQSIVDLAVGRAELHRVLALLKHKSGEADWNIRIDAGWLEPGQTSLTLN